MDAKGRPSRRFDTQDDRQQTAAKRSTLKTLAALALVGLTTAPGAAIAEDAAPVYSPADSLGGLRIGEMRGFEFHDAPRPVDPIGYYGPDGALRDSTEFQGKVALVNLWALWCAPCLTEMPAIDRLAARMAETHADDVVIVGLNVDRGSAAAPLGFLSSNALANVVFRHDPSFTAPMRLAAAAMPTTILLDRRGDEIGRFIGPAEWDSAEAVAVMERAAELP